MTASGNFKRYLSLELVPPFPMAKDQAGPLLQDSQLFCIQTDMPVK